MKILGGRYLNESELRQRGVAAVGNHVLVHESVILVDLERIEIASHVRIDAYCVLSAAGGHLKIGNHVHIGCHATIFASKGVEMGDFAGLSQGGRLYSVNDDYTGGSLTGPTIPSKYLRTKAGKVLLGRHVVVGAGSIVLPGITIGDGSTVGALSLVTKNLDPWGVYVGVPAKRLKSRSKALLDDERALLEEELANERLHQINQ